MSSEKLAPNFAPFSLREVLDATGGVLLRGDENLQTRGVTTDTREVQANNLFIALRGEKFDGHNFLNQAKNAGAVAAIVENVANAPEDLALIGVPDTLEALGDLARFHRQKFDIPVVAITGSYGKTTTRALLEAVLQPSLKVLASQANFNNEIGVPLTLLQLDETHQVAVLEMGMRGAGQIRYLAKIAKPTIGVITNIGPQHIELLGSLENIAAAKAELLECLPPDGIAVLPADDKHLQLLQSKSPCRVVTFGTSGAADYRATEIKIENDGGISFDFRARQAAPLRIRLSLTGAHNAVNAAAALAVADVLGVPLEDAARELSDIEIPGARMRVLKTGGITIIDDSYNAGPDSMRAALETLQQFPNARRRVAILGAMKELGNWSEDEHRKIGKLAANVADILIGVGDETQVLVEASNIEKSWCKDAASAANIAKNVVKEGDVILVKGSRSVGLETVVSALADE